MNTRHRAADDQALQVKIGDLPRLADIGIVRLVGPEAEAFAQSQFMNDVLALAPGHWHWNGWLSAKGRVQALFALARVAPGEVLLLLLDQPSGPFRVALERFVLRRKLKVIEERGLGAFAEWPSANRNDAGSDALLGAGDDAALIGFDLSGAAGARRCWVAARHGTSIDAEATRRWRDEDLRHGLPRIAPDREHSWTPHMLSLDRLKAFSISKGCYPGQEIVARTHFLGRAKRQAWWVEGSKLAAGQTLQDGDGRALGEVIEASGDGRGALAVAALSAVQTVCCGGGQVLARPPLGGLARPA